MPSAVGVGESARRTRRCSKKRPGRSGASVLVEWVADNPLDRLAFVPAIVPLVTEGMPIGLTGIGLLSVGASSASREARATRPAIQCILTLRLEAETAASGLATGYPFAEITNPWTVAEQSRGDTSRREAETRTLCHRRVRGGQQSLELVCSGREEYAKSRRVQAQVRSGSRVGSLRSKPPAGVRGTAGPRW